jgi:hypothetical protein
MELLPGWSTERWIFVEAKTCVLDGGRCLGSEVGRNERLLWFGVFRYPVYRLVVINGGGVDVVPQW